MSREEKEERKDMSKKKLLDSGAHYVAETIRELPDIIEDINERMAQGDRPWIIWYNKKIFIIIIFSIY